MQHSEKQEFGQLLTNVMAYYGKDASDFLLDAWWGACSGVSLEQVQKAINQHIRDAERGAFPPKVSDIVRSLQGTATDRATIAWGKVLGAMGSVGAYTDVVFDDAAIHAAIVDCGGWTKICRGDLKDLSYLQHRFCQAHKAYTERGEFEYPRQLGGDRSPDSEYLKYGRPLPKPALVGDPVRAAQVMRDGGTGGPAITFKAPSDVLALVSNKREAA
jgi:hypothetical protein